MKWLLACLTILLIALILESGLLAYSMYVLLGLMLVSRYLARNWLGNLGAERRCSQSVAEVGESILVELTVRNRGWLPIPWVLIEDLLPRSALSPAHPRLQIKGHRLQIRMLRSYGQAQIKYRIKPLMRGYYQIGPLVLEGGDLFGLHRRNRVLTKASFVLVYPRVVPLQGYDLASRRPIGEVRLTHRLYEDPTRVNGVREYQAGDPLNRVHWRATARMGALHCKVYEPSTLSGATLLLDFHRESFPSRGEPYRSELSITAAVSLAEAVYDMGQQVGLVTNGRDAADRAQFERVAGDYATRGAARQRSGMKDQSNRLRPVYVETRRGVEQLQRIRETLARLDLTSGLTLAELATESASRMPRDATVVAVLAAVPVPTALALGNLVRRGFAVSVILISIHEDDYPQACARLLAEGVLDIRHLEAEEQLPSLCQGQLLHTTPYRIAVEV